MYLRKTNPGVVAFTLVELLVVVVIFTLVAVLSITAIRSVLPRSESAACVANLRTIHPAFQSYLQENRMRLPWRYQPEERPPVAYKDDLEPYLDGRLRVFICPAHPEIEFPAQASYGMNFFYDHAVALRVTHPSRTILLAETAGRRGVGSHRAHRDSEHPGQLAPERHQGMANYLFFDGSVRSMDYEDSIHPVDFWGENIREDDENEI